MTAPRRCIDCLAEYGRRDKKPAQYRPAPHPGPRCASHHRQKQKLSKAGAHERRVQKTYGLAPGEYGRLYLFQGKVCAICRRATGATRKLSVDHDHKTGAVRGLLCRPCNDLLGHIRDDLATAQRIVNYLHIPPAKHLQIQALHIDHRKESGGNDTRAAT